jgi:hypothetical protein
LPDVIDDTQCSLFAFRNRFFCPVKVQQADVRKFWRYYDIGRIASETTSGDAILKNVDRVGDNIKKAR